MKVNNGRLAAILNLNELNFFKMHPLLKPYNLFYSNGVDILSGFHDSPQYQELVVVVVNCCFTSGATTTKSPMSK